MLYMFTETDDVASHLVPPSPCCPYLGSLQSRALPTCHPFRTFEMVFQGANGSQSNSGSVFSATLD